MSFTSLLKHSCSIARTQATAGIRKAYVNVATSVACLIQPLDPEATQSIGMTFGKAYKGFFEASTDIREADRITDQTGRTMSVRGLRNRNYGQRQHIEAVLEEDKAN